MNHATRRIDAATTNAVAPVRRSYPRLESECGFGTCSGHPACRDRQCPEHPIQTGMLGLPVLDTMTDDRFNLHRVDTSQLDNKDCMSFGGLDHLPIEMIEPIPSVMRDAYALKTIALGGALLAVIVGVLYVSTL